MKLSFSPYTLQLRYPFALATGTRTTTPAILVQIHHENLIGYGEASLPPYLEESAEEAILFLSKLKIEKFNPLNIAEILKYVDEVEVGHNAAKASIDIALHDLVGKILNKPCYEMLGIEPINIPYSSYTISIDAKEVIKEKLEKFNQFKILKIKLGKGNDKELITTVKSFSNKIFSVDANQGWIDKHYALDMAYWLKEQGALFIEQPFSKNNFEDTAWLTEKSPLPIIADESIKRLEDVKKAKGVFHGINIKLMKSTGIHEALKMIALARELNLKIMIGCMTETSCAVSAAAQLAPLADWCDLDGVYLINNDPFSGNKVKEDGEIVLGEWPGLGIASFNSISN